MANGDTGAIDRLLSDEQRAKDERAELIGHILQWVLAAGVAVIAITLVWSIIYSLNQPRIREVDIANLRVVGDSELCVGEWLTIAFDTHVEGEGVLILDASTQRISPPRTVVFSNWLRFPIRGPVDEQTTVTWQVPHEFPDAETGQLAAFPAGAYLRNVALSAANRGTISDMESVPFTVIEDCQP